MSSRWVRITVAAAAAALFTADLSLRSNLQQTRASARSRAKLHLPIQNLQNA